MHVEIMLLTRTIIRRDCMFFAYSGITFAVLAGICCCCINNVSKKRGRYFVIFTVAFLLIAFSMVFCLHNLPDAEYKEPELIYEVQLNDEKIEGLFETNTEVSESIQFFNDEYLCELGIKLSDIRFVNSDMTNGLIFQIYKIDSESSIWLVTRETKYECIIQY